MPGSGTTPAKSSGSYLNIGKVIGGLSMVAGGLYVGASALLKLDPVLSAVVAVGLPALAIYSLRLRHRRLLRHLDGDPVATTQTPDFQRRLRNHLRERLAVALAFGLILGLAFSIATLSGIVRQGEHAQWLLQHGLRTPGIVVAVHGNGDENHFNVRYTVSNRSYLGEIDTDSDSPRYHVGEGVTVVYNRAKPTDIRTTREENDQDRAVGEFILGLLLGPVFLGTGIWMLRRWSWMSRLAKQADWHSAALYTGVAANARERRSVVAIDDRTGHVYLASPTGWWSVDEVRLAGSRPLIAARSDKNLMVASTDGVLVKTVQLGKDHQRLSRIYTEQCKNPKPIVTAPVDVAPRALTGPAPAAAGAASSYRFNSPPGWPPAPPGFVPPAGWQPDPTWPPAPANWQFWLPE